MAIINPFAFKKKKLSDGNLMYMINLEDLNADLIKYMDSSLINICKGRRVIKLETVKKELLGYLESKEKSNLLTGSVAEFFIHLFLSRKNFKQEFLYFNLEEGSIKKGFDGYYTKSNEEWILESKSGIYTSINQITHPNKITEAYRGLKNKIEGRDKTNNPWENAYNHASHANVNSKKKITDIISQLSEDYTNEKYRKVNEFNIIPCSTIFLEENWDNINETDLLTKMNINISDKKFNKIIVICLNKKSLKSLIDYLKPKVDA